MKKVWLINHYAMPPHLEPRIRTIKFAEYLTEKGYDVTVIGASSMHNMDINLISDNSPYIYENYNGIKFIHVKAMSYRNMVTRVINLFQFSLGLIKHSKEFQKPDIILHTALVPFGNILYYMARKMNARYFVEVLDLWPESFVMTGLMSKKNPMMKLLYEFEKWLYAKANGVIFSMEGGGDYIRQMNWSKDLGGPIDVRKIHYINNGIDLREFQKNKEEFYWKDPDLDDTETFKVVYIGSIRLFNNIGLLLDAAEVLKENNRVKIIIYGDGDEREKLEKMTSDRNLYNVIFKEKFVKKEYLPSILSRSNLNVLNYQQNDIWKYGGSQSKLFLYLASAKPIVSNIKPNYCIIDKYKCGISKHFESGQEYADAILKIYEMNEVDYKKMCTRALKGSHDFDYKKHVEKLIDIFESEAYK